eukprot:5455676-Pyramimonas_sp.AAC.1
MGSSVELLMGPRSVAMGRAGACERRYWGLRWNSLWGHETIYCMGYPCGRSYWVFGGAPYGATKRCAGCGKRTWPRPVESS